MKKPTIDSDLVHNLKVKKHPYDHGLGGGLVVRIRPSGYKSLQFKYRLNGRKKTLTIGDFDDFNEHEIMQKWKEIKDQLESGLCPIAEQRKQNELNKTKSLSINDIADTYLEEHVSTLKRPEQGAYLINKHIKPKIGKLQAYELTLAHVHGMTKNMAPTVARKAAERLNSLLNFSINKGLLLIPNPLNGNVKNFGKKGGKTERTLSFDQIEKLILSIGDSGLNIEYQNITILLLLTGQRKQEWFKAKWEEIDFKKKTFTIPPSRLKTAKTINSKTKSHVVHLSSQTIKILNEQYKRTGHTQNIFLSSNEGFFNESLTKAIKTMKMNHFTPHDLRRTFFTRNADLNVDVFVLEKILNHKMTGVLAHYNFAEYIEQRKQVLNFWAEKIMPSTYNFKNNKIC